MTDGIVVIIRSAPHMNRNVKEAVFYTYVQLLIVVPNPKCLNIFVLCIPKTNPFKIQRLHRRTFKNLLLNPVGAFFCVCADKHDAVLAPRLDKT